MIRYYITDRRQAGGLEALLELIRRNIARGVEMVQIREKDLSGRELYELVRRAVALAAATGTRILVNERADIAVAAGAGGVHLPSNAIPPVTLRRLLPPGMVIGVSCHSVGELRGGEVEGADFAVYGPVFSPLSKASYSAPVGLKGLREAASAVRMPVLALGGITPENTEACIAAGAAGVAGITLFQR